MNGSMAACIAVASLDARATAEAYVGCCWAAGCMGCCWKLRRDMLFDDLIGSCLVNWFMLLLLMIKWGN